MITNFPQFLCAPLTIGELCHLSLDIHVKSHMRFFIKLRRGERPEEVARVKRAKELETSLEEYISDEAKDMLQKQLEDFDNRWEDVTSKVDEALKDNAIVRYSIALLLVLVSFGATTNTIRDEPW